MGPYQHGIDSDYYPPDLVELPVYGTTSGAKFDLGAPRSRFRHLSAPTHRPGPFVSLKLRKFIIPFPRSLKSWFFGKSALKVTGVVTNGKFPGNFFEPDPDWSGPKRFCTCHPYVSRYRLTKSTLWLCTFYWGFSLNGGVDLARFSRKSRFFGTKSYDLARRQSSVQKTLFFHQSSSCLQEMGTYGNEILVFLKI